MSIDNDEHAEPVTVASFATRGEAEVTHAHLASEGVESFIIDVTEGGAIPVDGEPGVMVVVHPVDLAEAQRILTGL